MPIANVALTDTFDYWRTVTNSLVVALNGKLVFCNTSNANTVSIPTSISSTSNLYVNIITTSAVNDTSSSNIASTLAVNTVHGIALSVAASSNAWANTLSTSDRAVANAAAISSNSWANLIVGYANSWANTLSTSDRIIANAAAVSANSWANTKLSNTSGVSFAGNLFFPTGNVGVGTSSTTARLHAETTAGSAQWGIKVKSVGVNNDSGFYVGATNDYEVAVRNASGTLTSVIRSGADSWVNLSTGNFGIGTASPSQKLHVVGTAFATTDFRAPIFYDSDNTSYYADPAGNSNFWAANFNTANVNALNTTSGGSQYSVHIFSNQINSGYSYNATAELAINYVGYLSGSTQFRDTRIFDGKTSQIAFFQGSDKGTSLYGGLGVGTTSSSTVGEIRATNNITAYYSDKRLKNIQYTIPDAVAKVKQLSGVVYVNNDVAETFGYTDKSEQVGVLAQDVEQVLPQIVKLAPFDTEYVDGVEVSKSGENYKTVQYEKLIPLLIEAIKELSDEVETLKSRLGE